MDLDQKRVQGAFEDHSQVSSGELVGEQVLELVELVAGALVDGDLQLVATRSEGGRVPVASRRKWCRCRRDSQGCGLERCRRALPIRERAQRRGDIGLGRQTRHELFEFAHGLVLGER